jgi:hypothetical protein
LDQPASCRPARQLRFVHSAPGPASATPRRPSSIASPGERPCRARAALLDGPASSGFVRLVRVAGQAVEEEADGGFNVGRQ